MLKLIMAVSADGYLARGPYDDMTWTSSIDKKVFKLLTSVGAVCGAGSRTFSELPPLHGRRVVKLTRKTPTSEDNAPLVCEQFAPDLIATSEYEPTLTLGQFCHLYPEAWLLGGPTVAMEALSCDMVDQVYLCRSDAIIADRHGGSEAYKDWISPWLMQQGEIGNEGIPWQLAQRIPFDSTLTVDCWSRRDVSRS